MINGLAITFLFVLGCNALVEPDMVWAIVFYMYCVVYTKYISKPEFREYVTYGFNPYCPETVGDADYD